MNIAGRVLAASLALGSTASLARAADIHLYRGGENDVGATPGSGVVATVDLAGGNTLAGLSNPSYSSDTAAPGSTLSIAISGGAYLMGNVDAGLTASSSFVMELWFKAQTISGARALVYNGNTSFAGIGLYFYLDRLQVLRGGTAFDASSNDPLPNAWNHVALVWDDGDGYLYLNGAPVKSITSSFTDPDYSALIDDETETYSTSSFMIGGNQDGGDTFSGLIDEVRIFSFSPGTFSASMLNYSAPIPEPASFATLAAIGALLCAATRRRQA